jgi:hypothetical protein
MDHVSPSQVGQGGTSRRYGVEEVKVVAYCQGQVQPRHQKEKVDQNKTT